VVPRESSVAMVCSKCEKKLSRGIHQEMWKDGSRQTIESGGRKINQNMALSGKKRWTPYGGATGGSKCKICKQSMHQAGIYCQKCAYHKGMCSMCGVKVMDTTFYNMGGESAAAQAARRSDEAILAAKDDDDGDDPTGINGPKASEEEEETENGEEKEAREAQEQQDWLDKEEERRRKADEIASNRIQGTTDLAASAREHATAATGQQVTAWQYDASTGYYYDVASQMYFDPQSQRYYDAKSGKWVESEKPNAAMLATGDVKPVSFAKGTRQPDKWGL